MSGTRQGNAADGARRRLNAEVGQPFTPAWASADRCGSPQTQKAAGWRVDENIVAEWKHKLSPAVTEEKAQGDHPAWPRAAGFVHLITQLPSPLQSGVHNTLICAQSSSDVTRAATEHN